MTVVETSILFFSALSRREINALDPILSSEVIFDYPDIRLIKGRNKVKILLKQIMFRFKTLEFIIEDSIYQENKVCIAWNNSGLLLSEKLFRNSGVTLFHFYGNEIIYISDYFKIGLRDGAETS